MPAVLQLSDRAGLAALLPVRSPVRSPNANGTKVQYRIRQAPREDAPMLHSARILDPFDRVSEVIFGVLMAMTFIGTLNIATAGGQEVRTVMVAALGCNVAWGLTDGVM